MAISNARSEYVLMYLLGQLRGDSSVSVDSVLHRSHVAREDGTRRVCRDDARLANEELVGQLADREGGRLAGSLGHRCFGLAV